MNVIFLDFDGVLFTIHDNGKEDLAKRILLLSKICKDYDCKVVIEASLKSAIDEDTMETDNSCVKEIFSLFKKYGIECIGRTPTVERKIDDYSFYSIWKEDEIRLYLFRHPEVLHYCVIDDDDFNDLEKVKNHLVRTKYYSKNYSEEGLLPVHKDEIGKILKKDNEIRKFALKKNR